MVLVTTLLLPQRIQGTSKCRRRILSLSKKKRGGIAFFSGMNDQGDFFTGENAPRETFLSDDTSGFNWNL